MSDDEEYFVDKLGAADLNAALAEVFELTDGWALIKAKLPPGEELPENAPLPLEIKTGAAGIEPGTATVIVAAIVAVSPVVQKIAFDLWKDVWLPKIKGRKGANAIGKRKK